MSEMKPLKREELYLNRLAGVEEQPLPDKPLTREELYYNRLCGGANEIPDKPLTRKELFLAKLNGEEVVTPEPLNRIEQYMAFATGETEDKPENPRTREEWYWDNYQGGAVPEEKTVSGNPIHVTDAVEETALALSVAFEPTQAGTPFVGDTTTEPYLSKTASTTGNKRYLDKIVGGTVAWNQLEPLDASKYTKTNIALSLSNGEYTFTPTTSNSAPKHASMGLTVGHVYFVSGKIGSSSDTTYSRIGIINTSGTNMISIEGHGEYTSGAFIYKLATNEIFVLRVNNATSTTKSGYAKDLQVTDLTLMFGSTIADYIYSLETSEAGAGVQWLKDHGFIDDNYRAYNAGQLISCRPEGIQYGSTTHAFGSPVDLRGLYRLDANNKLYCDGDELTPDGALKTNYDYRAYQSGDEELTDAITDGTNTVVKKVTPTTSSSETYTNPAPISNGDTESFTDTRAVPIPVGNESHYAGEYEIEGHESVTVYHSNGNMFDANDLKKWKSTTNITITVNSKTSFNLKATNTNYASTKLSTITQINSGDSFILKFKMKVNSSNSSRITVGFRNTSTDSMISSTQMNIFNSDFVIGEWIEYSNLVYITGDYGASLSIIITWSGYPSSNVDFKDFELIKAQNTYSVTFTEQGTVYGGVIDIVTGALSITWGYIASYNGETLTGRWVSSLDVYAEGTTPTTGAEVAYELASPITAQLTPQQVDMLLGENTVWTDGNENITLTYMSEAAKKVLAMNRKFATNKQNLEIKRNGGVVIDKPVVKPISGGLKK